MNEIIKSSNMDIEEMFKDLYMEYFNVNNMGRSRLIIIGDWERVISKVELRLKVWDI